LRYNDLLSGIKAKYSKRRKDRMFYLDICTLTPCKYGMPCYGWDFTTTTTTIPNNLTSCKILDIF
jgi:hypothetical protein